MAAVIQRQRRIRVDGNYFEELYIVHVSKTNFQSFRGELVEINGMIASGWLEK